MISSDNGLIGAEQAISYYLNYMYHYGEMS